MKRGQVTVFVLAGFIIIIALSLLFTAAFEINKRYSVAQKNKFISYEYNEGIVRSQVDACIDGIVDGVGYDLAFYAGYLSCLPNSVYLERGAPECKYVNSMSVPVMFDAGGSYFLPKEEIEKRICRKLHVDLGDCFDESSVASSGVDILSYELGASAASADEYCNAFLGERYLVVDTNYSLLIAKGDFQTDVSGFIAEEQLPLLYLYQKAEEFAMFVKSNAVNGTINLSVGCISHADFLISTDEDLITFTYSGQVGALPYVFQFSYDDYIFFGQCQ